MEKLSDQSVMYIHTYLTVFAKNTYVYTGDIFTFIIVSLKWNVI